MSTPAPYFDRSALMNQLNSLLKALRIPISLHSPTELTPSLLIAILESLLSERIPYDVPSDTLHNNNLQKTKIFLGVLEMDVLQMDVGLSNLDPRELANGSLEECVHVGELLCFVGRQHKLIVADDPFEMDNEAPKYPNDHDAHSPSTSITTRESLFTSTLSTLYGNDTDTSIDSAIPSTPTPKSTPRAAPRRPRCIHEVPSPSVGSPPRLDASMILELRPFSPPSPPRKPAVRRTGYISPVDEDSELLSFEQSRSSTSRTLSNESHISQADTTASLIALRQSTARTLALYQERARLLEEMARLQNPVEDTL